MLHDLADQLDALIAAVATVDGGTTGIQRDIIGQSYGLRLWGAATGPGPSPRALVLAAAATGTSVEHISSFVQRRRPVVEALRLERHVVVDPRS